MMSTKSVIWIVITWCTLSVITDLWEMRLAASIPNLPYATSQEFLNMTSAFLAIMLGVIVIATRGKE